MLLGVTVNSRSDTTNEHKIMIVHVKVNKSTEFQQLNPICVTVSPEKVLKLIQFHTCAQTNTTHVVRCYCKLTIGHN